MIRRFPRRRTRVALCITLLISAAVYISVETLILRIILLAPCLFAAVGFIIYLIDPRHPLDVLESVDKDGERGDKSNF
jgi:hypothetical protein